MAGRDDPTATHGAEHATATPAARRTIIIGDVHGCIDELERLLELTRFDPGADALYFVGDLIARGPASAAVVELASRWGRAVRGNHEERLLRAHALRLRGEPASLNPLQEALYAQLHAEHWAYLTQLPLTLALPAHGLRIVHAGCVPGVPLERQEAPLLLNLRSLDRDGKPSVRFGRSWAPHWRGPEHLVFGHNALARLQLEAYATGLDTACVYGERLTALVLDRDEPVPPVAERGQRLVSVRARRAYWGQGE